jgi:hypothetical protein
MMTNSASRGAVLRLKLVDRIGTSRRNRSRRETASIESCFKLRDGTCKSCESGMGHGIASRRRTAKRQLPGVSRRGYQSFSLAEVGGPPQYTGQV